MQRLRGIVGMGAVAVLLLIGAACGSSSSKDERAATTTTSGPPLTTEDPLGLGPVPNPDAASAQACRTELDTLQTATEAYRTLNGEVPASGATLVTAEILQRVPTLYDVHPGPDGAPVFETTALGSERGCAAP